jgi:FkbM family methyltransferase
MVLYRITKASILKLKSFLRIKKSKNSINRFTPAQLVFHDKKLFIHDIASYELGCKEVFNQEIYKFQAQRSNPTIVDCGANLGMSVIYFKELYPDASIIAFEPDPHIFGFLQKNVESFGFKDVETVKAAVWDSEGWISFQPDGGAGGKIVPECSEENMVQVKTVRLRDILTQKNVDFLKIDIEGAEHRVINDCKDILGKIDFLFIEYHSIANTPQKLHEILQIVYENGFRYHIKEAFTRKFPFVNETLNHGMDLQLNIFCCKESEVI